MDKPKEYEVIGFSKAVYNGREYFGSHAPDRAELAYLRDLTRWQEERIARLRALLEHIGYAPDNEVPEPIEYKPIIPDGETIYFGSAWWPIP